MFPHGYSARSSHSIYYYPAWIGLKDHHTFFHKSHVVQYCCILCDSIESSTLVHLRSASARCDSEYNIIMSSLNDFGCNLRAFGVTIKTVVRIVVWGGIKYFLDNMITFVVRVGFD